LCMKIIIPHLTSLVYWKPCTYDAMFMGMEIVSVHGWKELTYSCLWKCSFNPMHFFFGIWKPFHLLSAVSLMYKRNLRHILQ
jgi:hypothetical protein